jgi:hypothetical protein
MNRRFLLPLAWLLAVPVSAVVVEVNLPYKELRLKDGMVLNDVVVKSFNTTAGTAFLVASKDLISLRTSLLPDEVNAVLQKLTPVQTPEEREAEKQQEAADRRKAAENAERRQRQAEAEAQAARAANRDLHVNSAERTDIKANSLLVDVAAFAEERARAHFRYQADPHSNIGAVIGSDIFLEVPEEVPGWPGRYRVEGIAYRQFVNTMASGFDRSNKAFEVLIQTHDGRKPEVVELRIK